MASKIYLCVDTGSTMGIATLQRGIIKGTVCDLSSDDTSVLLETRIRKIKTSIRNFLGIDYGNNSTLPARVSASMLWTQYAERKQSAQSLFKYIGNCYMTRIALEQMARANYFDSKRVAMGESAFSLPTLIHDDTARSVVFYGRKLSKPEAHKLFEERFDTTQMEKKKSGKNKGRPYSDAIDAAIGCLAHASRNGVNIQALEI